MDLRATDIPDMLWLPQTFWKANISTVSLTACVKSLLTSSISFSKSFFDW